jgi:hypothetical protein
MALSIAVLLASIALAATSAQAEKSKNAFHTVRTQLYAEFAPSIGAQLASVKETVHIVERQPRDVVASAEAEMLYKHKVLSDEDTARHTANDVQAVAVPVQVQAAVQAPRLVFVTAYVGDVRPTSSKWNKSVIHPIIPSASGRKYPALAFTTVKTDRLTGFGAAARDAGWTLVYMDEWTTRGPGDNDEDLNNISAKRPKIMPHAFPEIAATGADIMVWCDNKWPVNVASMEAAAKSWPDHAVAMLPLHPTPNMHGALDEIALSMSQHRYRRHAERIKAYVHDQVRAGLSAVQRPRHLTATVILWRLRSADGAAFQKMWWSHIQQCGIQDQVSLCMVEQLVPTTTIATFPGSWGFGPGNTFIKVEA